MKPLTREWVEKAEGDWLTARREFEADPSPNFDAVCFHAQQCAEKYLKAVLQEHAMPFLRTHRLDVLLDLLGNAEPALVPLRSEATQLSTLAISTRYPGMKADQALAEQACRICDRMRKAGRRCLGAD